MVAKESVKTRFERPGSGDLLHRVQLHAAAGLRLPAAAPRPRLRRAVRRQRPVGQHHHGRRLRPQGLRRRGLGLHHPAHRQGRRDQVRQDRVGHGLARSAAHQPFAMYQFFLNTPDEQVGELLAVPHLPRPRRDHRPSTPRRPSSPQRREAQRALARAVTGLVHGEAEVAKCEEASAALFGEEIAGAQRGDAAGRDRGRAHHDRAPASSSTVSPWSTSSSAPVWPSPRRRRGAPSSRGAPTSTTSGRPTTAAPSHRPTSCTTATSCSARAAERSTSSRPHEAPVPRRRPSCS